MSKYDPKKIERKWRNIWKESCIYKDYFKAKKFYALDMFPYPSGAGLHVGHPKGYIATDVFARFKILQGYSVLHPMGWDAFGLPAENFAIKNKIHPEAAVRENIKTFKKQLELFGFTYDWDREINTTDPEYYKWTQWIFLKMFEKGLAYESDEPINWCPSCKTGLALEDLEKGLCERCGSQVVQKKMRQWVLKMTEYADRLLEDLDKEKLDWEDSIIEQQKNWIGRSEGATIKFEIKISNLDGTPKSQLPNPKQILNSNDKNSKHFIEVYTTRVDTIYGCTYCVVAPEHELISNLKSQISNYREVEKYIVKAQNKTNLERTDLQKEKTGVELKGIKAVNPFNNEEIPVYVADYVIGYYGTGAVMAVPAHDERDFEFAKKYNLPITVVIAVKAESFITNAEERHSSAALILNSKDKILVLFDKLLNNYLFPRGGIKSGELPEEAAQREASEEAGYSELKLIDNLGCIESYFYAKDKKKNMHRFLHGFSFRLLSDEKVGTCEEHEKNRYEVHWLTPLEVEQKLHFNEDKLFLERATNRKKGCFVLDGILVNSDKYSGMTSEKAREEMAKWLKKEKIGKKKVNFKMRDWVFSRQRYWGEPIPIIHCDKCGTVGVPEKDLPIRLPKVKKYEPTGTGESPLANIKEWVNVKCPKCGGPAKRETNTMPQWAGSSWYYLRYIDPKNNKSLVDKKKEKEWMPVNLYVGGAEHATRHLLYARFWHKFLYDIGVVFTKEPFQRLMHVGLINGEDGRKMSKRWGNVINPDDIISEYGADSIRLYEMFMGPFAQNIAWSTKGVIGMRRFLEKIWEYVNYDYNDRKYFNNWINSDGIRTQKYLEKNLHTTTKKVSEDIENLRFNTAISSLMIFMNSIHSERTHESGASSFISKVINIRDFEKFLILLSPFAPHITEEIWQERLGHKKSIFLEKWPKFDEKLIKDEEITLIVQVNGKVRDQIKVSAGVKEEEAQKLALSQEKIIKYIEGKNIRKTIFVKDRLINFVI